MKSLSLEPLDDLIGRYPFGGLIDDAHLVSAVMEKRGQERQRIWRLRGPQCLFAFLATALSRECDAVDERRVDEQGAGAKHETAHFTLFAEGATPAAVLLRSPCL